MSLGKGSKRSLPMLDPAQPPRLKPRVPRTQWRRTMSRFAYKPPLCYESSLVVVIVVNGLKWKQSMREYESADSLSLSDPVFNGRTEVNSRIDARFTVLGGCFRKARKRSG